MSELVICGVPFEEENVDEILHKIKADGFTAVQIYVFWKDIEPEYGIFDFSLYDEKVSKIVAAGLKFVPFFIMGPAYGMPDWWRENEKHMGLVCREHLRETPIESIWNPHFRHEISRVVPIVAAHYMDVMESFQPGICGDYGESIMPVHGNWPGSYHTHIGYWCMDKYAVQSFRNTLEHKYLDIDSLNNAWNSHYADFNAIEPFLKHRATSRTAWFDLLDWYRDCMTEYVEFWIKTCRDAMPNTPLYMCTGGMEEPEHASLFSDQAKVCAKYNAGIRLTNEQNNFFDNFFLTAYTHSACEFYGAYLGLEPVGPATAEGVGKRLFGSAVYGNRQLFYYYWNIYLPNEEEIRVEKLRNGVHLLGERKYICSTACFWPTYFFALENGVPKEVPNCIKTLRKLTTIMPVNEPMIADGALDRFETLIIPVKCFTDRRTLINIAQWVKNGGTLLAVGRTTDLELECVAEFDELFGITAHTDEGEGCCHYFPVENSQFPNFTAMPEYVCDFSFFNLRNDTIPLAKSADGAASMGVDVIENWNAFYADAGKGRAIMYNGPLNFEMDPQSKNRNHAMFPQLLKDVVRNHSLLTGQDEVARGYIGNDIYVLSEDGTVDLSK